MLKFDVLKKFFFFFCFSDNSVVYFYDINIFKRFIEKKFIFELEKKNLNIIFIKILCVVF